MEFGGFSEFVYKPLVKILFFTVNYFIAFRPISKKKILAKYYKMVPHTNKQMTEKN